MKNSWENYYKQTKSRPPSPLLKEALIFVENKKLALDLGAGALVESKFLLDQGFEKVVAIDIEKFDDFTHPNFTFIRSSFERYDFPENEFDLVNANFSLPFNDPTSFPAVWKRILNSLVIGGIFSGQLFGLNDDWSKNESMNFHSKKEVETLLEKTEVVKLEEIKKNAPMATGGTKNWHIFAIIFKRLI